MRNLKRNTFPAICLKEMEHINGNYLIWTDMLLLKYLEENAYIFLHSLNKYFLIESEQRIWIDFQDDMIYSFLCDCTSEEVLFEDAGDWLLIPEKTLHSTGSCQTCRFFSDLKLFVKNAMMLT